MWANFITILILSLRKLRLRAAHRDSVFSSYLRLKSQIHTTVCFPYFFFYPLHHLKIAIYWDKREDLSHRYISVGKINRGCQFSAFLSLLYSLVLIWPTQSSWQK